MRASDTKAAVGETCTTVGAVSSGQKSHGASGVKESVPDLLAVAHHKHLRATQQRRQRRHVGLRRLVEHHEVEGGGVGGQALRGSEG